MRRIGIGYRQPLSGWIASRPAEIGCLELTAEHFFDGGDQRLLELSQNYPLFLHGLGLSLGTPGPLDAATLAQFARVARIAKPAWISEHIAFTRTANVDLGHLNPVRPAEDTLETLVAHARQLRAACDNRPLVLENIASHLRLEGDFSETEFLNRLCERADCGLLLDVTNLFVNSRNHAFDARQWLHEIDPGRIRQLHVVGYTIRDGRYEDYHGQAIQDDLLELVAEVLSYAPAEAVILERDGNFEAIDEIAADLRKLEAL